MGGPSYDLDGDVENFGGTAQRCQAMGCLTRITVNYGDSARNSHLASGGSAAFRFAIPQFFVDFQKDGAPCGIKLITGKSC